MVFNLKETNFPDPADVVVFSNFPDRLFVKCGNNRYLCWKVDTFVSYLVSGKRVDNKAGEYEHLLANI